MVLGGEQNPANLRRQFSMLTMEDWKLKRIIQRQLILTFVVMGSSILKPMSSGFTRCPVLGQITIRRRSKPKQWQRDHMLWPIPIMGLVRFVQLKPVRFINQLIKAGLG